MARRRSALEPELACVAAMRSPETGIIDSHRYMLALRGDLEDQRRHDGVQHPDRARSRRCRADGCLQAGRSQSITGRCGGQRGRARRPAARRAQPKAIRRSACRGCFSARAAISAYAGRPVFSRLIYPAPIPRWARRARDARSCRPHALRPGRRMDRAGELRRRCRARADAFYASIREYCPGLPDGALVPDYAGIRPKLTGPGEPAADFMIDGPAAARRCRGWCNLFGIEFARAHVARCRWPRRWSQPRRLSSRRRARTRAAACLAGGAGEAIRARLLDGGCCRAGLRRLASGAMLLVSESCWRRSDESPDRIRSE